MRVADFEAWLRDIYASRSGAPLAANTRSSRVSNCLMVERYEGDLDGHFQHDCLCGLINKLTYSIADHRHGRPAEHLVPINGNLHNGSASLKAAVMLYQQFCEYVRDNGRDQLASATPRTARIASRVRMKPKADWPEWPQPDEKAILALAGWLTPFVRFLNPDIVAAVAEDNERRRESWGQQLHECGIDPGIYLWPLSPCAFPGVRRYAGSKEIAQYRGHTGKQDAQPPNALRLDDNDFPKQAWSFILRGKPFQKFGPKGYALAHLADHKDHNNRCDDEFELPDGTNMPECFFGLYTSVANAAYVPTNFLRPTDCNGTLRTLLQRKAQQLYSGRCNLVPPPLRVKAAAGPEWEIDRFAWAEPVGNAQHLESFLEYRARTIDELLSQRRP